MVETVGFGILILLVVFIALVAIRRVALARSGGFDVSWRCPPTDDDRGWMVGQAKYRGDELIIYRWFAPLPTASLIIDRGEFQLGSIRPPRGSEHDLLPPGVAIVPGQSGSLTLELALGEDALTALRSWSESRPPGSGMRRMRRPGT